MVPGADAPHILRRVSSSSVRAPSPRTTGEEGRAFLQERLAFLGKVFCLIGVGFYLAGEPPPRPPSRLRGKFLGGPRREPTAARGHRGDGRGLALLRGATADPTDAR